MDKADPIDPDGVDLAKRRFINLAVEIDPFSTVRKHPLIAVGTAATIGAVAASPAIEKSLLFTKAVDRLLMSALPLINQVIQGARSALKPQQPDDNTGET